MYIELKELIIQLYNLYLLYQLLNILVKLLLIFSKGKINPELSRYTDIQIFPV